LSEILVDRVKYRLETPNDEKQLEEAVEEHSKEIFGEASVYFDLRHRLTSKSGVVSIPDGYVISWSDHLEWFIVEAELATHPLHEHITNQLNKFMVGIKNSNTQRELVEALYDEILKDKVQRASIETKIGSPEIKGTLYELIAKPPKIVVIIDEKGENVKEASEGLKVEPLVIEFKSFIREDAPTVHAHLFEPVSMEKKTEKGSKGTTKPQRDRPPHRQQWDKRLEWVEPETRNLVSKLTSAIEHEFPNVNHRAKSRWYYFYRGEGRDLDSLFAVLIISKKKVTVRIKSAHSGFTDERKWTKQLKGWFFPRELQERQFTLPEQTKTDLDNLSYALKLIKQSYELITH
jgi:hypothetical protein